MNNKGQSVLSEHVMVFFVVVAALVAMTTYVQRGFEARIDDAKNYMISAANSACDANCQQATGKHVSREYEPYYSQVISDSFHNEQDMNAETKGNAEAIGAIYYRNLNEETETSTNSIQLPPFCAGKPNGDCQYVSKTPVLQAPNGYQCSIGATCVSGFCNTAGLCETRPT